MARTLHLVRAGLLLGALSLVIAACDGQGDGGAAPKGKAQATCPVMDGKIDKQFFADHEGKRVYFCCEGCIEQFKKEPQKFIKKLEDAGVVLEKTPSKGG